MIDSSADRDPLDRLAEEFVARYRAGERPALTEYTDQHPELADQIRDLFPALIEMEQLKPGTDEHTGPYTPAAEPTDPTRVGEFRILRRVGRGGMGVVYEAVQESLGRHVALKILPAEALVDPRRLERFRREARAAARLHHTNIVPVFGVGEADGRHYYAMQFIAGHPLDAVVTEVRRLKDKSVSPTSHAVAEVAEVAAALMTGTFAHAAPPADSENAADAVAAHNGAEPPVPRSDPSGSNPALSGSLSDSGRHYFVTVAGIGAQAADALAYAHGQGILHRDIKPANLLLDLHGTVWVTDFGLAKANDADDLTHTGDVIGTLRYMAPERFDGAGDHRADIYALGLTLYELLTLRPAFVADNRVKLVQEVTAANPPKPRSVAPAIPRDLETIVLKAIARDPAARYQTAAALADDLRRFLDGRTITARRARPTEQAWRWCRRNPAVATLLAAVLVVFAAGAGVSAFFAVRAGDKAAEADRERGKVQGALKVSQDSEARAAAAERESKRQAASSLCDVGQQLCERGSVVQGLTEYGRALDFAHQAGDADLEEAVRWNIDAWAGELHQLAYTVPGGGTAAFDPTGKTLAVGIRRWGGVTVRLYDAADGRPRPEEVRLDGPWRFHRLAWRPDGGRLAVYTEDGRVYLWTPGEVRPSVTIEVDAATAYPNTQQGPQLAFSPDGTRLIAGTSEPTAQVFDAATGEPTGVEIGFEKLHPESRATPAVDWSKDGKWVLAGNHNGTVKLADAHTGKVVREVFTGVHGLNAVRFSPDGTRFVTATGFGNPRLQVWDAKTGRPVGPSLPHRENVNDAAFSPDGRLLAAVDNGCEAWVWEIATGQPAGAPAWAGTAAGTVDFHPSGRRFLTVAGPGVVRVWSVAAGLGREGIVRADPEEARVAPFRERYKDVVPGVGADGSAYDYTKLALSPDGRVLIRYAFFRPTLVEMIDAKTLTSIRKLPGTESTAAVYWKPDGREFVTAVAGNARVRDADSGAIKVSLGRCDPWTGAFRPDGARFAIGAGDYHVRFFDTATWTQVGPSLPHTGMLRAVVYSRDGRLVLTADNSVTTRLWHAATGKRIGPVLPGGHTMVAPDGRGFSTWDEGKRVPGFRMPVPVAGEVADVLRRVESAAAQHGALAPEPEPTAPTRVIGPAEARGAVGQRVTVEMVVASVGFSRLQEFMYLNSAANYKDAANFAIAVRSPTPERRKAMGLDRGPDQLVGRKVRVTGTITIYRDITELIVEEPGQLVIEP